MMILSNGTALVKIGDYVSHSARVTFGRATRILDLDSACAEALDDYEPCGYGVSYWNLALILEAVR